MIPSYIIDEIYSTINILIKLIGKNTQILLIGQSANYLKYCFPPYYDVKCVAMSGRVFIDNKTIPKKEDLFNYYEYLKSLNIEDKQTILIDHSHTGTSITSFSKILNRYFNFISRDNMNYDSRGKRFDFINLISPLQSKGCIKEPDRRFIKTLGYIIIPHLVEIANEKYPRTIHHYPHWKWNQTIDTEDYKETNNILKKIFNDKEKVILEEVYFKNTIKTLDYDFNYD
jgi:hypothetical protein